MNKKISTLMMGGMLLAVPSLVSAQSFMLNDKVLKKIDFTTTASNTHDNVVIVRDVNGDGSISSGDIILVAEKNQKNELTYKTVGFTTQTDGNKKIELPDESTALWSFTEYDKTIPGESTPRWLYSLKNNNTGVYLTGDYTSSNSTNGAIVVTDAAKSEKLDTKDNLSSYFKAEFDSYEKRIGEAETGTLYLHGVDKSIGANALIMYEAGNIAFGDNNGLKTNIILATAEPRTVGTDKDDYVDELNDVKGGKGFEFEVITEAEGVLDNIFDGLELRAFRVDITPNTAMAGNDSIGWPAEGTNVANYYEIPAGVYLATEWSQLDDATLANNTITTKEEFQKATFIAVSPTDWVQLTNTVRANGVGFALTTVKGSEMNFYAAQTSKEHNVYDASQESKVNEVYVGNACFTITVSKPFSDNDQYQLSVADARIDKEGKGTQVNANTTLYISEIKNTNNVDDVANPYVYLLTNTGSPATLQAVPSLTIADVTKLLNEDATPAIYAVKFLSGEDDEVSEYGQYLTWESNGSFTAAAMPSVNNGANENDPLYQFVVTGVIDSDKDDNYETIELTNRLTKQVLHAVLYTEEEMGNHVYTIYPATSQGYTRDQKLQVATTVNGQLVLEDKEIRGMIVQLIKKENVDKFATFETAKSEEGLYTFEFAKTAESGDRLYAAAVRNSRGEIQYMHTDGIVTSETPDQFELIRVKVGDEDKISYILNDFIYKSNGRVVSSPIEKDTVAFYSYNVRFFAPDEEKEYYLANHALEDNQTAANELVIKYNVDGSVSIFNQAHIRLERFQITL